jgi:HSP20 family molecular chaperone IbpA
MTTQFEIPKELLMQADFNNTVSGGMVDNKLYASRDEKGYSLTLTTPSIDKNKIHVTVANQRFMIYYMIDVLEGDAQMPYFLVNLPVLPDIDVNRITARYENNALLVRAPFSDWAKGISKDISLDV